jgi:hypothetical protein
VVFVGGLAAGIIIGAAVVALALGTFFVVYRRRQQLGATSATSAADANGDPPIAVAVEVSPGEGAVAGARAAGSVVSFDQFRAKTLHDTHQKQQQQHHHHHDDGIPMGTPATDINQLASASVSSAASVDSNSSVSSGVAFIDPFDI